MRIVVIGDGKVGRSIIENISLEGHEVIVIDSNEKNINELVNTYDVMGVCGNGVSYEVQKSAGVDKADLVIAVTVSDEVNILACLVAKKLGVDSTIARVRNYEYSKQTSIFQTDLGITMAVNPESSAADEITKILNFPEAMRIDSFNNGIFNIVEVLIPQNSSLIGQSLIEIKQKYQLNILVCAVLRDKEAFIPNGSFVLKAKDKIYITAETRSVVKNFLNKTGILETKMKNVMIVGGGKISAYLGASLAKHKFGVKIIEKDYERCKELSSLLDGVNIIHGDGSDQELLIEEGLDHTDAIVCLTGSDEENIIISMFAGMHNVKKVITKVNRSPLAKIMDAVSEASIISPKQLISSKIISYVRAYNNTRGSNVITLYKLVDGKVEALEFKAKEDNKLINIPLKDLKIKKNILLAGIVRDGKAIIPSGDDYISAGDNVIVVTTNQYLDDLKDILE